MTIIDDLKTFAAKFCIDIFNDFDEFEILSEPQSVQQAWKIGKELKERYADKGQYLTRIQTPN